MAEALRLDEIQVVGFDWNGVLVGIKELVERDKLLAKHHKQPLSEQDIWKLMGEPAEKVYATLTGQPNISEEALASARNEFDGFSAIYPRRPIEGVHHALEVLTRGGVYSGVLTGGRTSSVYQDAHQASLPPTQFLFFNTGGETGADAEGVQRSLERTLGKLANGNLTEQPMHLITREQFLLVGDEPKDMALALAVGVEYLIVSSGAMNADRLTGKGVPPEHIIPDLSVLPEMIDVRLPN
jgi:phosphoglycolate phosphatase-like HAD superfamily hydrolase